MALPNTYSYMYSCFTYFDIECNSFRVGKLIDGIQLCKASDLAVMEFCSSLPDRHFHIVIFCPTIVPPYYFTRLFYLCCFLSFWVGASIQQSNVTTCTTFVTQLQHRIY